MASVGAILGKLPTPKEYLKYSNEINSMSDKIFKYLNFDQMSFYQAGAEEGERIAAIEIQEMK